MGAASIPQVTHWQPGWPPQLAEELSLSPCSSVAPSAPFPFLGLSCPLWKMRDMEEISLHHFEL